MNVKLSIVLFFLVSVMGINCTPDSSIKLTKTADEIRKKIKKKEETAVKKDNNFPQVPATVTGTLTPIGKAASAVADKTLSDEPPVTTETPPHSFDFCVFPETLKKTVLQEFKTKDCALITQSHLVQTKKLVIRGITANEIKLLNKKYGLYFSALEDLDLSDNPQMSNVPEFVFYISTLKKLNISNTGIRNLNKDICKLKNLTTLVASGNNYEGQEVPIAVFCLNNLRVLDMSYSSLRYIDEYVYYLKNLEEFYLRGNQLMIVPVVLHLVNSLLVLDLRDNQFENQQVNSLYDCKKRKDKKRKECQTNLLKSVECEYWYKVPFQRGKSFRMRYTEMTGEQRKQRSECIQCADCYNFWLHNYVSYYDPDKAYLLDLTISGKTMREWRLALDKLITESSGHWQCELHINGISLDNGLSSIIHLFIPKDTSYAPVSAETHIERYRSPSWDRPKACAPINYNTPLPTHGGPWAEALPTVQSMVDALYPTPKGCKYWPTSICKSSPSEEYYLLGEDSMKKPDLVNNIRSILEKEKDKMESEK